jgi:hypothetical protein
LGRLPPGACRGRLQNLRQKPLTNVRTAAFLIMKNRAVKNIYNNVFFTCEEDWNKILFIGNGGICDMDELFDQYLTMNSVLSRSK